MAEQVQNPADNEIEGQTGLRPFAYRRPEVEQSKAVVVLARTDRMFASVQVLREGGENNLHSHPHQDGFWMVLSGRARFYGDGDELIADLGPHEGVLVPRGTRYWFESAADETLELLQIEAFSKPLRNRDELINDRVNHSPLKPATLHAVSVDGRT